MHLLKEGRPSRPNTGFSVVGLISLSLILLSTILYLLAFSVPDVKAMVDDFRIVIVAVNVTFDYSGIEFLKMVVCIPISVVGALLGSVNLILITNRKPFLSALHIIPGIGFIASILGFVSYYFLSFLFTRLPIEFNLKILYYAYVYSILVYASGVAFADIFALFYSYIYSSEFSPIYSAYRKARKCAKKNSKRSLIRYQFRQFWKQRRYDELLYLLLGHNIDAAGGEELNEESYHYLRNRALRKVEAEKIAQLDELYESGHHDLLRKELASMELDRSEPRPYEPEETKEAKKIEEKEEAPHYRTIEVDDGEEELTRYGRKQAEKGRRKAMREARKHHAY